MADFESDLVRQLKEIRARLTALEHHSFAIMYAGDGAPGFSSAEGVLYWDYTGDDLYINHNGGAGWGIVVAL